MTDERLCVRCQHLRLGTVCIDDHCGCECSMWEAAPSTDEGEAQWAREIADRWVNSAMAEDRETVVLTECEKHPGVMPEWSCPICVRALLEERIRELEAELNGTVETYVETTGDMGAEVLELRADVERLREALRDALDTLLDYVPKRAKPYRNGWVDGWWALATPPSSTEGTKEVEG